MPNIIDILARALSLRQETELNSITPNRAGGIMYDTLLVLNQMQLEGGSLLISKVYSSVAAMEADTTPTSDLTGRALRPGQLVVIVTSNSSSSDMGSEYRFNGPGSWTYVGKVGGLPLDTVPTQSSTKGITSGGVYTALAAMKAEGYKYMGLATPGSGGTAPGTPNQPVFYIAGPGSYPNFGSITVASGYLGFIKYSGGSWSVESVAVGKDYDQEISQLGQKVDDLQTGKYYGYFAQEEDLPDTGVDGFAYVGQNSPYTIYNLRDGVWTSSDIAVNQSPIGNDEDIDQNEDGKLQFADRVSGNGMGYVILRKNKTFAEQVTDTNTIYEIRYDFNLSGATVTIPSGCILKFEGGKISGGTLNFGDALIDADDVVAFDGVTFSNCTSNQKVKTIWFGITQNGQSNSAILENILDSFAYVFVNPGVYTMERQVTIANTARIKELTANKAQMAINAVALTFPNSNGFVIKKRIYMCGVSITGNRGTYNAQDKVFENGYVGIDLYVSCVIEYCTITTWATGIETYNGDIISGVIRKCVFQQCGNYGLRFYSDSTIGSNNANLVADNYFINCGYDGITGGTESTGKTSGIGMYVKGGSGNTIFHNVFEYCSGIGLFIDVPTTKSVYRGLVIIGNYFEYCKWSNMYVDLSTSNLSLVYSIVIKGNSYSDSNMQLPADAQVNRYCNILDLYGMMYERYIQTDFADRTLYQKYGGPLLFDMSMLTFYNTGWDKIDWDNNCIRFIPGSNAESFTFVRGKANRGYYAIMVNCRNAGASNKVLSIQYKVNSGQTITKPISLMTSENTFARYAADTIFSDKEFEIVIYGAYSGSMQEGDRVEFNEIVLQEITSVSTAVRETLTPYAGFSIFDSTLNKMVLYNGNAWVNMDGTALS